MSKRQTSDGIFWLNNFRDLINESVIHYRKIVSFKYYFNFYKKGMSETKIFSLKIID